MTDYHRGMLVWASLDPVRPGEQGRTRPCVILSYNAMNHSKHPCVIVCPITGKEHAHRDYPTHVLVPAGAAGLTKDSILMAEQIRVIAKSRILANQPIELLPEPIMKAVEQALLRVLAL